MAELNKYGEIEDSVSACPQCRADVQTDWVACPKCGQALKKKCNACGKLLQADWIACPYCGDSGRFTIVLCRTGSNKIGVIKELRDALGFGLKDAKDVAEGCPRTLGYEFSKTDANALKQKLETAGASVEIRPSPRASSQV